MFNNLIKVLAMVLALVCCAGSGLFTAACVLATDPDAVVLFAAAAAGSMMTGLGYVYVAANN